MSIDIEQKKKALDAALLQIEKQYGKGAVMKLGDPSVQMNIETIPTGSLSLDIALGLGGMSTPRISALTSTTFTSLSPTAESRLWRSPRPWSDPELLTSL